MRIFYTTATDKLPYTPTVVSIKIATRFPFFFGVRFQVKSGFLKFTNGI